MKHPKNILQLLAFGAFVLMAMNLRSSENEGSQSTVLTPHMETPVQSGQNLIFCPTFQIAWHQLRAEIVREDILLEKPAALVPYLNKGLSTWKDLWEPDYVAMAGFAGDDVVGRINGALGNKFGGGAPRLADAYPDPETIIAYAYLEKVLRFENVFENLEDPLLFHEAGGRRPVTGFGIELMADGPSHQRLRAQVEVIRYERGGDLIIRLKAAGTQDDIILAKVRPERDLLSTYEKIRAASAAGAPLRLNDRDILKIPKIDFSISRTYTSLLGLHLRNRGFEDYFFAEARQAVRFRLDETGAAVRSEGKAVLKKGEYQGQVLIFNGPFMLYIKKKEARYPYLALWIDNTELMIPRD
jgi:hypothetical protein